MITKWSNSYLWHDLKSLKKSNVSFKENLENASWKPPSSNNSQGSIRIPIVSGRRNPSEYGHIYIYIYIYGLHAVRHTWLL